MKTICIEPCSALDAMMLMAYMFHLLLIAAMKRCCLWEVVVMLSTCISLTLCHLLFVSSVMGVGRNGMRRIVVRIIAIVDFFDS
jgi:hypothetical protein